MNKLPQCHRCIFYTGTPYLVCAVHPSGPGGDSCLDFESDLDEEEELWEPEGARYIGGELVLEGNRVMVDGIEIIQLDMSSWHPMFTGKCPRCGASFDRDYTARVHWDCEECGWIDDSV
jgi:hypothetical protein